MIDGTRREFVTSAGAIAAVVAAGCLGDDGDGGSDDPEDHTGRDVVNVDVGAGNGLEFAPADVRIDVGTTIVWEWTGQGGGHDVVETDGAFESDLVDEAGHTFEHTFAESGTYEYVCTPHQTSGMVGTVTVVS